MFRAEEGDFPPPSELIHVIYNMVRVLHEENPELGIFDLVICRPSLIWLHLYNAHQFPPNHERFKTIYNIR